MFEKNHKIAFFTLFEGLKNGPFKGKERKKK